MRLNVEPRFISLLLKQYIVGLENHSNRLRGANCSRISTRYPLVRAQIVSRAIRGEQVGEAFRFHQG